MGNILIFMLITPRITILKILESALDISSILTFFSLQSRVRCMQSYPRRPESLKITSRMSYTSESHSFYVLNLMRGRYIKALHAYLLSFVKRTQPLVDVESQQQRAEAEFNEKWEAGEVDGWEESSSDKTQLNGNGSAGIWCSACTYDLELTCAPSSLNPHKAKKTIPNKPYMTVISHLKNT